MKINDYPQKQQQIQTDGLGLTSSNEPKNGEK
jgi:hypothetical protein